MAATLHYCTEKRDLRLKLHFPNLQNKIQFIQSVFLFVNLEELRAALENS